MNQFRLNANAKKQDIIDQYKRLLDAHTKAVKEGAEARKQLTEMERRMEEQVADLASEATVSSVVENLGKMRGQLGATLNDLTDQMSAQAEKLEGLGRAVAVQEARLKDLYDLEAAADALQKLTAAYEERKTEAEAQYEALMDELNSKLEARKTEAEAELEDRQAEVHAELEEKQANLETAIEEQRAKWLEEKSRAKRESDEYKAETAKTREREEAEYVYSRDRARKLEQDEHDERRNALEKELVVLKEKAEQELAAREAAVAGREKRMGELEAKVEAFPKQLEQEIARVRKETAKELSDKAAHDAEIVDVERSWEKKNLEQRIAHLEQVVAERDKKIEHLGQELAAASAQVNEVAKKAIEGASLNRAFHSVNEIALEQARKPEGQKQDR
jgi:uncharacterized coiled-coil protein SlyX